MNKLMVLSAAVLVTSGCATLKVSKDKVAAAKKVAIVGYGGSLALESGKPQKNSITAMVGDIKGSTDMFSGKLNARRIEQAEAGYQELAKRLEASFGYSVNAHSTLASSQTFSGELNKAPNSGVFVVGIQHLPDVLRPEIVQSAKPEVRAAMATELGVDALVAAKIRYEVGSTSGVSIGGMGSTTIYPRAVIDFAVYDASGKEVWRDVYARGETAAAGLANTMGADIVSNETEVLNEALAKGFDALLARYQSAP